MNRLQSILVGVDFTPCSASALRQAIRIAQWNQARLHVVHVVETLVAGDLEAALGGSQVNIQAGIMEDVHKAWPDFISDMPEASRLSLHVEVGHPVETLMRLAAEHSVDLLVLGTYGTSEPTSGAGTLASACVRSVASKILLVWAPHARPFQSVVACVDFSETSYTVLEQAVRIAIQDSSRLHVLHVFSGPWNTLWYRTPTARGTPDYEEQYRHHLEGRLREFCAPLKEELEYLKAQYNLVDSPRRGWGIAEFAEQAGCDLVVLGTRGRSNLRNMLWGSTAERVVRDAPCSILTIPSVSSSERSDTA